MNPWIIPALAFAVTALAVGTILYALTVGRQRVGLRLEAIRRDRKRGQDGRGHDERPDQFPIITSVVMRSGRYGAIERHLARAGLNWRPGEYAAACLGLTVVLAFVGWLGLRLPGAAAGALAGVTAAVALLGALAARRQRMFEHRLPDALMLIATSVRSGYGISRAVQAVRDEMDPPISVEFGKILDDTTVGVPIGDAFSRLLERVPLPDLSIAVTAILIQLDVGGNLAEVLEIVANTVRERQRLRSEMDTLTAEGRLSGLILLLLPVMMAVILMVLNPTYMSALFQTSLGHLLLVCGVALQIMGGLVIKRMLRLEF
jgi:tight adherence protein B